MYQLLAFFSVSEIDGVFIFAVTAVQYTDKYLHALKIIAERQMPNMLLSQSVENGNHNVHKLEITKGASGGLRMFTIKYLGGKTLVFPDH